MQTDRRTGMTKQTVAFRNFAEARKNQPINAYMEIIAVRFEIHNNRRNTLLGELNLFNFEMALRKVDLITGRQQVNLPLNYFVCHCQIICVPVFYKFSRDICIKSLIIAFSMNNDSSMLYIFARAQRYYFSQTMIERRHLLFCILDVGSNLGPASGISFHRSL